MIPVCHLLENIFKLSSTTQNLVSTCFQMTMYYIELSNFGWAQKKIYNIGKYTLGEIYTKLMSQSGGNANLYVQKQSPIQISQYQFHLYWMRLVKGADLDRQWYFVLITNVCVRSLK